jgi:DNA replication and repair protein RecF
LGGLAIETLALSHFRSHRATRLTLDGRPVALVGPNGAGKTNVLEAISLLSPGRGLRRAAAEDLARRPESLGWKVGAAIDGISGRHEVETWAEPGEARQQRVDGKAAPQSGLGRVLRILWIVPAMDRLWIESSEGRRRFLDRLTLSFAPDHAEHSLIYEKAMRDRNRLIRDQVTDPHWYTALEAQMAEAGRQITLNRRAALARIASAFDASSAFPAAGLALTGPDGGEEPDDLAHALADGRRRDIAAGRALVGPHRADLLARYVAKDMAADQCSTGEQKALLISLVLANARALAQDLGRAPILLLDEVAAHLDETRRAALYDEICALGAQAVMTGTDDSLFAALPGRGVVLSVRDDGSGSSLCAG